MSTRPTWSPMARKVKKFYGVYGGGAPILAPDVGECVEGTVVGRPSWHRMWVSVGGVRWWGTHPGTGCG